MGATSCSDAFLQDKKNYDNTNTDLYNYESGVQGRVNDIYAWCLPVTNGLSWKYTSDGSADEAGKSTEEYCGFSGFVNPEHELSSMENENGVPDYFMGQKANIQEAVYGRIRNINDVIKGINEGTLDQKTKDLYLGQVYFFRAWCYYNLVRWYGGVPIVKEVSAPDPQNFTPRSSTKACIDFILSDLKKAAEMLSEYTTKGGWSGSDYGRVTTGTALALKGRVLLLWASPLFNRANDQSRWQTAYEEMSKDLEVIDACGYGLYKSSNNVNGSDFAMQFLVPAKNTEAVFVTLFNNIASNDGLDNQKNNSWERSVRPANTGGGGKGASAMLVDMFPMADGKIPASAGTYTKLTPSALDYDAKVPFVNRDPRFYRTFGFPGFRWAYNGDASLRDSHNPSDGKNYILWNYVWYTEKNEQGDEFSGNSYAADNLLSSKQGVYVKKKSDDLDVNPSALYTYVANDTKGSAPFYSAAPLIEMRYAEVLLNLAEVACGAGKMDVAVEQLQKIRERAGYTAEAEYGLQSNLSSDQAACMSAILYERQIEFAYEGKRFDDCRRWMLYDGGAELPEGAPSTWKLTGWGGNTCTWLGFKQLNGQRRENMEFCLDHKFDYVPDPSKPDKINGTTWDADPLLKTEYQGITKKERDDVAVDLRQPLATQVDVLADWYKNNLVRNLKRGDGYSSSKDLLYMKFYPKYYFLGLSRGAQVDNKGLQQTIGWKDYNNGGTNGTFDPLAE